MAGEGHGATHGVITRALDTESQFAALVDSLAADPDGPAQLIGLLREDHPLYDERGAAATVRMRGWVLLALARTGVSDAALPFVLEELDTGVDAYLVAAAARALRSYPGRNVAFAPRVMRAISNVRYHDDLVSFENYGEYALTSTGTSPVRELLATLAWLGPSARGVLHEVEALRAQRGMSKKLLSDVDRAVEAIRDADPGDELSTHECCTPPHTLMGTTSSPPDSRAGSESIEATLFEDHEGASITFGEFFRGHPSVVVFFYTRCNNPLKCSVTITKLGRLQKLLEGRGLADQIHTAAITYDPGFDVPERMRAYGLNRGLRLDEHHRMLRTTCATGLIRSHFKLGVNFVGSLVNRHRVEAYILDAEARIAASFERTNLDEQQLVEGAIAVLNEDVPVQHPGDDKHCI
ncbi:MAG TPA: SCO family protein [Chloroflexota bacterium]|jgi:protein SCO1/2